ncbi:AI-2E family transporter [Phaeovulum sp. W22_SRMD_FR3]|uniref:AI-2E family transporter n=1 Tax=Phaeovulum sp. W22_SRMD_FR3 TaxID=3240274 RepID=UPI003F97ECB7
MTQVPSKFKRIGFAPGWAVIGIFLILAFAAITLARDFLMPTTLAILLFFVFIPVRRALDRFGIPPAITAGLITLALLGGLALLLTLLMGPAGEMIANGDQILAQLNTKMADLRGALHDVQATIKTLGEMSGGNEGKIVAQTDSGGVLFQAMTLTPALLGQLVFMLFLLFFLISSGDLIYLKIVQSFDTMREKRRAYAALREIEASLGNYLGTITLINAALGLAIGLAMAAWGMPAPAMFGVIAFLVNYIPYLGAISGTILALAVALVSFDGFWYPCLTAASYLGLTTLEGQLITPYFVSRRLQMNTVVVFLAVALWAWLWSVLGMIVAVPMLVVISVLCEHIPGLEKLGNFLAGDTEPAPDSDPTLALQPRADDLP